MRKLALGEKPFAVPYLLGFGNKFGRGEAGWTVAEFDTAEEAEAFANRVPRESQPPCFRNPNRTWRAGK